MGSRNGDSRWLVKVVELGVRECGGGCCYGSEQFMTLVLQNKQTLFYVEHWFSGSFRKIGKTKLTQQ